ncbi:hypothetical protein KP509_1Z073600 [Ceratopteris richardii]|nr:hypothetical protein KP509_1Z073600 [Ceratopteris richardii]
MLQPLRLCVVSSSVLRPLRGYFSFVFDLLCVSSSIAIIMALRGVWQLKKLQVAYCDFSGSSKGVRRFIERELPAFKEQNPQLEVETQLIRGKHPFLKGFYVNQKDRVVGVKNLESKEILLQATRLRSCLGRKVNKLKTRVLTHYPSVQGTWKPDLNS